MENILNSLYEAEKLLEVALEEYRSFVADKSNSLEERWQLFLKFEEYIEADTCVIELSNLEKLPGFTWYDTFGFDKGYTVEFSDVIEQIEDSLQYEDESEIYRGLDLKELKEEMLATGYSGFVYDW